MKNSSLFLLLSLVFSFVVSFSAAQQAVFNKVYFDEVSGFHILGSDIAPDHGYVMVGRKYDNSGHVIKIDSSGTIEWSRQVIASGDYSEIHDVICYPDSTIITAGVIYSPSVSSLNVIKWDRFGDTLWTRSISGIENIQHIKISRLGNSGLLIIASDMSYYSVSNVNSLALKLSESGDLLWSKLYTSSEYIIMPEVMKELPGGNLVFAGYTENRETNEINLLICGTDESGNPAWSDILQNSIGSTYSEAYDISVTSDGFIVLAEVADRTSLIKCESSGIPVWSRTYSWSGGSMWTNVRGNISSLPDGSLIIGGSGYFGEIMKTDDSGVPQWLQSAFMEVVEVVPSWDDGYLAFGNGPVFGVKTIPNYLPQIGAYKIDSEGNGNSCINSLIQEMQNFSAAFNAINIQASDVGSVMNTSLTINSFPVLVEDTCVAFVGGVDNHDPDKNSLRIYPNPATEVFSIEIPVNDPGDFGILEIINELGRLVYTSTDVTSFRNGIKPGYLSEGIYLVRIISGNNAFTGKLVIKH